MKVGFFQFSPIFGEKNKNLSKVIQTISKVNADLIVLPELFTTGYAFESKDELIPLAEEIPGPTTLEIKKLSSEHKVSIVGGIAEISNNKLYNSSFLVTPQGNLKIYRKAHLFFKENIYFTPGDTRFEVHDIGEAKVGLLICFDWIFPEAMRSLALKGAEIICHSANLVMPHCQPAMLTRALENRIFIITANRIGVERGLKFTGKSQIVSPEGKILARAGDDQESLCIIDIDPGEARNKQLNEYNNLFKQRRKDLYEL